MNKVIEGKKEGVSELGDATDTGNTKVYRREWYFIRGR
jgi:hypothetical protein